MSSPDKEPIAVATKADNRMLMKMMNRNLMTFSFPGVSLLYPIIIECLSEPFNHSPLESQKTI